MHYIKQLKLINYSGKIFAGFSTERTQDHRQHSNPMGLKRLGELKAEKSESLLANHQKIEKLHIQGAANTQKAPLHSACG